MREIVFDTETTGLDPRTGDRLIEIGCVELLNHIPTGRTYHQYINPERPVSAGALEIHGLSDAFLADKPVFSDICGAFVEFVGEAKLVAHNASFDMGFINMELDLMGNGGIGPERVVDTLMIARRKHPGAQNSLDALCARYGIDNSRRTKHGALLDAELLAEVYIELTGGKQADLGLSNARSNPAGKARSSTSGKARQRPAPLAPRLTEEDREAHARFVDTLGDDALWRKVRT